MKQLLLKLMSLLLFITTVASAQNRTISGTVTSAEDNQPMPSVTVMVKGTTTATQTDVDGKYSISAATGSTLVFSFVGYTSKEVKLSQQATVNIAMVSNAKELGEVVVTALGIKKERKALGYSVSEVKGSELTQARENNVVNSLVGKVAGLNVASTAGGAGSSSSVTIRGASSLGQSNQPLYVINGVPMESQPNANPGGRWDNAPDLGDAISNINPDDIESISVLKGAAASALYGYRAKAGVILITTKGAKSSGIEFNSNYVAEQIMDPSDWQYVYGQGANNIKPTSQVGAAQVGQSSWGAKLDGSNVVQFDGESRPYSAQKNNLENFYRTGGSWTNSLALSKSFEGGAVRFSASNLTNNSVVPNSGQKRNTFNLTGSFSPLKNLTLDARANYILDKVNNRPFLSDGAGNANYNVMFLPTSLDVKTLSKTVNEDGSELVYNTNNPWATNPYFATSKFVNNTSRNRLMSSLSARYELKNGFFVQGRAGRDAYEDRYTAVVPSGTAYRATGSISETDQKFNDLNVDGLVGKSFKAISDLTITPNLGASYRRTKSESFINSGNDFAVFGVNTILNAKNKATNYIVSDQEVQSVYGTLELAYKNYLYLTASGRNDWFSTLAAKGIDNKLDIFYPSVSGSFVFSEVWQPSILSFGKIRAGYAQVGQATNPYLTSLSYNFGSTTLNGLPLGTITNTSVPNASLVASKATEIEIGTELKFLQNRLGLDLSWYKKKSENEILPSPSSITSGYQGAVLNTGELENTGFEALITGVPVSTKMFTWATSLNGAINNNKVISLAGTATEMLTGTSRSGVGFIENIVGKPAAQVMAYDYKYDANGNIVYAANGVPEKGNLTSFGSAFHKWTAGWNNEFTFDKVTLSVLVDGKFGGKIFSATDYYGYQFGLHKGTLVNREGTFGSGANKIDAATYYSQFANNVSKDFVQDASFIKLRQISLGYTFSNKVFHNVIQGATVSFVARNLFTLMKRTDNIDPEANYTANAPGLELGGVPPVRTFGLNLNVKF
ncbi:SusC/RagA family TonB-linked outer membrane protein [Solitalea sp. MAHUQ-68]|uniref:SusC/RagA family TonB-linked outer membrane protein n=1 Tax=Solitalea agri TaxID=2953739 RepID=A0A9X2JDD6_9SPHI|nr:SusC/RagA family TonB-linked outer membrane protein [Solitalea agri]MCO4291296.1 SusC/RagA family TonB-linked outer membrane protein [Solitalea agri]